MAKGLREKASPEPPSLRTRRAAGPKTPTARSPSVGAEVWKATQAVADQLGENISRM